MDQLNYDDTLAVDEVVELVAKPGACRDGQRRTVWWPGLGFSQRCYGYHVCDGSCRHVLAAIFGERVNRRCY